VSAAPRRRALRWAALAAALLTVAACGGAPAPQPEPEPDPAPVPDSGGLPFASDSPWNLPIPDDPVLDGDSEEIVAALARDGGASALLYDFGVPVYEADADTPRVTVTCTQDWGQCPVEAEEVPIPAGAQAAPGDDGALVVIDRQAGRVYDFWQAREVDSGQWSVSWGTWADYDGWGNAPDEAVDGGATGAGINLLAGVVRLREIRDGEIPHALAFASSLSCADEFRYPATKTDGNVDDGTCVPQGSRLQLDPSIDVRSIPDITPGEIAVAEALQTHGGYVRDVSGSALAVAFEAPAEGEENPYPEVAGFPWDYYDMPHIPWDRLRVLRAWDGG
jgi:hypothetical protein